MKLSVSRGSARDKMSGQNTILVHFGTRFYKRTALQKADSRPMHAFGRKAARRLDRSRGYIRHRKLCVGCAAFSASGVEQDHEDPPPEMKKRLLWRVVAAAVAVCFLSVAISAIVCSVGLDVTTYRVNIDGIADGVRLVFISDLHGKSFGKDDSRLIAKIGEQEPDAVCLVGDMIGSGAGEEDIQALTGLIEKLCDIAPVFFAPGNHELEYMGSYADFSDRMTAAGAVFVNDNYADVTVGGQPLRISGTMGHGFYFGRTEEEFRASPEYRFLKDFEDTDIPRICLAHMPDTFIFNGAYTLWDVDLVLSGHTHGGLIRLPFVGGLYAPYAGLFPRI